MRAPDGIGDWPQKRFRQWTGSRVEGHSDELRSLLRIVSGQNEIISELRRRQEILTHKMDEITRPGSTDYAALLASMAGDNEH